MYTYTQVNTIALVFASYTININILLRVDGLDI